MKMAVMQPYIFPYIGYFQLIKHVDTFILYDNVQYSKGGWINRNRVLMNGEDLLWSFSIQNDSLDTAINEIYFTRQFPRECKKFLRTLQMAYGRAPFYKETKEAVENIFHVMRIKDTDENIADKIGRSIQYLSEYLDLNTNFVCASSIIEINGDTPEERIIHLCKKKEADKYINLPGGKSLYNFERFHQHGIELSFLEPVIRKYKQDSEKFIPRLSIIDIMMFNERSEIKDFLNDYNLIHRQTNQIDA